MKGFASLTARFLEIGEVARHKSEVVDQSNGGDLLVERMVWIRNSQIAPDLRGVGVEGEKAFAKGFDNGRQPGLETPRLIGVTTATDEFDAAAQLADGNGGEKHRLA